MKITRLFFPAACVLVLLASTSATDARASAEDAVTATPATTITPTTGTYVFSFTITLTSTIGTSTKIVCSASILVSGDTLLTSIQQTAAVAATRSGSTATCTVNIPYAWSLGNPATDKITPVYTIQAPVEGATVPTPFHYVHVQERAIALPANGATTTETVATSL